MKFSSKIFLYFIGFSLFSLTLALQTSQTKIITHKAAEDPDKEGFWNRKVSMKSRWVKYWREKTIYVPVWKKVYSPVIQSEWVPLPNAPRGYTKPNEQYKIQEVGY